MSRIHKRLLTGVIALTALGSLFAAAPVLAAAPVATTGSAGSVTYQSAVLTGTVNPGGLSTEVYFQFGTTNKYGAQSAPTAVAAGTKAVAVSIPITGLAAGVTYHYRLVATNSTNTSLGADKALKTAKIPLSLAITAAPNPVPFGGAVTIEGTLSGTGNANAPVQLQQNVYPYTGGFINVGNSELTAANGGFAFNLLGIALNTQYRVVSGAVASVSVPVSVTLGVTLHGQAAGTHRRPMARFTGTIAPAEPSARIAFERLVGTSWKVVGGTVAAGTAVSGVVHFKRTVRIFKGGFFRALVLPVEGAHASGYSATVVIRLR